MKLAAIFSDNMVLLRDKKVCIFGEGAEGEKIVVSIDGLTAEAVVKDGRWKAYLPSHKAGGPYTLVVSGETEKFEFTNVMYGEVWLMAGQSNMELEIQNAMNGEEELKSDLPMIRYYNVIKYPAVDDELIQKEENQKWHMCCDGDFRDMSAVGYHFAKKAYEELQVPIGIIDCYQGGTSVSCWLKKENLLETEDGVSYYSDYQKIIDNKTDEEYMREVEEYDQTLADYNAKVDKLKLEIKDPTPQQINDLVGDYPWPPPMGKRSLFRPAGLYYSMTSRVVPYTIQGVAYYQGEEDADKANKYHEMLSKLICQYREEFENPELPFVVVQLPMFIAKNDTENYHWPKIRLDQDFVAKNVPNVGLVVLLDLGEYDNIHPTDKKTPGERLAAHVFDKFYGLNDKGRFMQYEHSELTDEKVCIRFSNVYDKIQKLSNGLLDFRKAERDGMLTGFELSEDGCEWYVANATAQENTVLCWCEEISCPKYVRYGHFNYGKVDVYNGIGLPLAPFCQSI